MSPSEFLRQPMVDARSPVKVDTPSGKPLIVRMHWDGHLGPVLTGEESNLHIVIENTDPEHEVKGTFILEWHFVPPWEGLQVHTTHTIPFTAPPHRTVQAPVPHEWLFAEGKAYYTLHACSITGFHPHEVTLLDHPLLAFTILERSTYEAEHARSVTTLVLAVVAAVGSVVAAVASLALAGLLHL